MILLLSCVALQGACASAPRTQRDPNLIERAEIEEYVDAGTSDLFELVERARPRWLLSRGARSFVLETQIVVYLNQQKLGAPEMLRRISPFDVIVIRRLDSARAGLLPGGSDQHSEGAIVVETRGRQ